MLLDVELVCSVVLYALLSCELCCLVCFVAFFVAVALGVATAAALCCEAAGALVVAGNEEAAEARAKVESPLSLN